MKHWRAGHKQVCLSEKQPQQQPLKGRAFQAAYEEAVASVDANDYQRAVRSLPQMQRLGETLRDEAGLEILSFLSKALRYTQNGALPAGWREEGRFPGALALVQLMLDIATNIRSPEFVAKALVEGGKVSAQMNDHAQALEVVASPRIRTTPALRALSLFIYVGAGCKM